jgi:hypothetical protein
MGKQVQKILYCYQWSIYFMHLLLAIQERMT